MDHSDQQILEGCRQQSGWAIDALDAFITPIIKHRVFTFDDWEDVRQHCLVEVLGAFQRTKNIDDLWAFARRITICSVIDFNRRLTTRNKVLVSPYVPARDDPPQDDISDQWEKRQLFAYVVQQLDETCRRIIHGLFVREVGYPELSIELGMTCGNIRVKLMRCRDKARAIREAIG